MFNGVNRNVSTAETRESSQTHRDWCQLFSWICCFVIIHKQKHMKTLQGLYFGKLRQISLNPKTLLRCSCRLWHVSCAVGNYGINLQEAYLTFEQIWDDCWIAMELLPLFDGRQESVQAHSSLMACTLTKCYTSRTLLLHCQLMLQNLPLITESALCFSSSVKIN